MVLLSDAEKQGQGVLGEVAAENGNVSEMPAEIFQRQARPHAEIDEALTQTALQRNDRGSFRVRHKQKGDNRPSYFGCEAAD